MIVVDQDPDLYWPPAHRIGLGERDSVLIATSGIIAWIIVNKRISAIHFLHHISKLAKF